MQQFTWLILGWAGQGSRHCACRYALAIVRSATLVMMDDGYDNSDTNTSSILGDVHDAAHPTSALYD